MTEQTLRHGETLHIRLVGTDTVIAIRWENCTVEASAVVTDTVGEWSNRMEVPLPINESPTY